MTASVQTEIDVENRGTGMDSAAGHCRVVAASAAVAWLVLDGRMGNTAARQELDKRLGVIARRHPEALGPVATSFADQTVERALAHMGLPPMVRR